MSHRRSEPAAAPSLCPAPSCGPREDRRWSRLRSASFQRKDVGVVRLLTTLDLDLELGKEAADMASELLGLVVFDISPRVYRQQLESVRLEALQGAVHDLDRVIAGTRDLAVDEGDHVAVLDLQPVDRCAADGLGDLDGLDPRQRRGHRLAVVL